MLEITSKTLQSLTVLSRNSLIYVKVTAAREGMGQYTTDFLIFYTVPQRLPITTNPYKPHR